MGIGYLEQVPVLRNSKILKKYATYLHTAEFGIDASLWLLLSAVSAVFAGIIIWFVSKEIVGIEQNIPLGALFFVVTIDLMIGYPYLKAQERIDQIEEALPDALRQIADTLKAGGTYEYALREVANAEYGPLKKEMNEILRKLEEGQNFENSIKSLYYNVDSRLVKRTATIIIDSVSAGAGLTSILEEIAEDVRATHRINKERKSKTVMQTIFMFTAGGIIAPVIFGFTSTIAGILTSVPSSLVPEATRDASLHSIEIIQNSIQFYLFIEVFFTSLMISLIREGKLTKSIIYFPLLLFMAYLSYLIAIIASSAIVGGVK